MNPATWQSPSSLAEAIGLSVDHVYANVDNYGGIRLGTGRKARIRVPETSVALRNMIEARAAKPDSVATRATRACPGPKRKARTRRVDGPTLKLPVY